MCQGRQNERFFVFIRKQLEFFKNFLIYKIVKNYLEIFNFFRILSMWKIRLKHFPSSEQQVAPINTMIVEKSVMIVTVTTLIRTMPARSILPFIILPCVPIRLSKISTKKSFSKFIVF